MTAAVPPLAEIVTVAGQHLQPLGNRWLHTQAVAGRAAELSVTVDDADRPLLVAAAWWHDIGYGHAQRDTGLHPLDGGRWLSPPRTTLHGLRARRAPLRRDA